MMALVLEGRAVKKIADIASIGDPSEDGKTVVFTFREGKLSEQDFRYGNDMDKYIFETKNIIAIVDDDSPV